MYSITLISYSIFYFFPTSPRLVHYFFLIFSFVSLLFSPALPATIGSRVVNFLAAVLSSSWLLATPETPFTPPDSLSSHSSIYIITSVLTSLLWSFVSPLFSSLPSVSSLVPSVPLLPLVPVMDLSSTIFKTVFWGIEMISLFFRTILPVSAMRTVVDLVVSVIDKSSQSGSSLEIKDVCHLCVGYSSIFGAIFLLFHLSRLVEKFAGSSR